MVEQKNGAGCLLGLAWGVASALGWAMSLVLGIGLCGAIGTVIGMMLVPSVGAELDDITTKAAGILVYTTLCAAFFWTTGGIVSGLVTGTIQWVILHDQIEKARRWVLATVAGDGISGLVCGILLGVAMALGSKELRRLDVPGSSALVGLIVLLFSDMLVFAVTSGFVTGIAQWSVLRDQFSQAGWWILSSVIGKTIGSLVGGVGLVILPMMGSDVEIDLFFVEADLYAISCVVSVAAYGAITAIALISLLRRRSSKFSLSRGIDG
jgi:hypothetical protein